MIVSLSALSCDDDSPPSEFIEKNFSSQKTPIQISVTIPDHQVDINFPEPKIIITPDIYLKNKSAFGLREFGILASIILAICSFIYTHHQNKKLRDQKLEERAEEEIDKFWFKTIVTPKIIEPCLKALDFESSTSDASELLNKLQTDMTILQNSFNLVGSLPIVSDENAKRIALSEIFEKLEDGLNNIIAVNTDEDLFKVDGLLDSSELADDVLNDVGLYFQARKELIDFIADYRKESLDLAASRFSVRNAKSN